jgi:hypothetical protein
VPAKLRRGTPQPPPIIHAIVTVCTRWIRRIASGVAIWIAEAIRGLLSLDSVVFPKPPDSPIFLHATAARGKCRCPFP